MEPNSDKRYLRGIRRNAMRYIKEYCDNTGIQGFKYVTEDRTLCERIWWMISLGLSIVLCGLMINQIVEKFINYPVIVTFSMQEMHVNEIPFPSVTICPLAKISQYYLNLTEADKQRKEYNDSFYGETEKMYNFASAICIFEATEEYNSSTSSQDFYTFLDKSRVDFILGCEYQNYYGGCEFTPILTENGLCRTFNILDREDIYRENVSSISNYHSVSQKTQWDIENGYGNADNYMYPKKVRRQGYKSGLMVIMATALSDIEHVCDPFLTGYKVSLNLPSKIPQMSESFIIVPLNQMVIGQITPHMIKTSAGVKAFDSNKRGCYFQSERSLKFFKIYNQENCLLECKTIYTLNVCGCVGFYMPRYSDTPVCLMEDLSCVSGAEVFFDIDTVDLPEEERHTHGKRKVDCDCLPTCTDLTYNLEISQNIMEPAEQVEQYTYSILNLHFKKSHVETKERNEVYGFTDFISNFGGLLGLFTGFSILSLVEIIYFLSLRIWGNMKLYKNWSGNEN